MLGFAIQGAPAHFGLEAPESRSQTSATCGFCRFIGPVGAGVRVGLCVVPARSLSY